MANAKDIINYLRAGYSCFWIKTHEPGRAYATLKDIIDGCERKDGGKYNIVRWDCTMEANPLTPIQGLKKKDPFSILFLMNFHWFVDKPPVIQTIQNLLDDFRHDGKALIVISPKNGLPEELSKDFLPMEFNLPDNNEIEEVVDFITESTDGKVKIKSKKQLEKIVNAAKGLTQVEIENVLSLSAVIERGFDENLIGNHKKDSIKKEGMLEVVDSDLSFDDIRGYDQIKKFVLNTISKEDSKGILILGPPGCGKTLFMKCLIGATGKIGLSLDFGKLFSKFQGETDKNIANAIKIIEAVGDCIVMVDEFEKQFAGAGGSGNLDSGVTIRNAGRWLRFMQDRPKGVYIIGTCNSFRGMPPEYLRPGRWDTSPFFIDLPNDDEKAEILEYHMKKNGIETKETAAELVKKIDMMDWTGAEIEALCRIARMMETDLESASNFVLPQAKTLREEIDALREWADGRTIPATSEIIKVCEDGGKKKARRKID